MEHVVVEDDDGVPSVAATLAALHGGAASAGSSSAATGSSGVSSTSSAAGSSGGSGGGGSGATGAAKTQPPVAATAAVASGGSGTATTAPAATPSSSGDASVPAGVDYSTVTDPAAVAQLRMLEALTPEQALRYKAYAASSFTPHMVELVRALRCVVMCCVSPSTLCATNHPPLTPHSHPHQLLDPGVRMPPDVDRVRRERVLRALGAAAKGFTIQLAETARVVADESGCHGALAAGHGFEAFRRGAAGGEVGGAGGRARCGGAGRSAGRPRRPTPPPPALGRGGARGGGRAGGGAGCPRRARCPGCRCRHCRCRHCRRRI